MKAVALLVLLAACNTFGWELPASLRTESRAESMPASDWHTVVAFSAARWNEALGCVVFVIDEADADAHPVLYIARDAWTHDDDDGGVFLDDEHDTGPGRIEIRERADAWGTFAMHELGHALGLAHDDAADSIMNPHPEATRPNARDLANARGACE